MVKSAIVYNDALTSKSDFSTEPTLCPQHIDEFDLKNETSLFEYDEVEQNILYFNDLFPFNIIYPDDLKSDKDNDDNEIDMIQSSRDIVAWNYIVNGMLFNLIKNLYVPFGIPFYHKRYYKDGVHTRMLRRPRAIRHMAPLPPREQRHPFLRYQGLEYFDQDIADFEERLERIHDRGTHRVQVLDFEGMPELMRDVLYARMRMEHHDGDRVVVFTSQAWGRQLPSSQTHDPSTTYLFTSISRLADLAAKKSTKLVKYESSGILYVIVVMLEYIHIYNTHPCS
ncbi:hypothetical protein Tco_0692588 [Tanacetum coccineum]